MDYSRIHHFPKIEEPLEFSPTTNLLIVHQVSEPMTSVNGKTYYWVTCELNKRKFKATSWKEVKAKPGCQVDAKVTVKGEFINVDVLTVYDTPIITIPVDAYATEARNIINRMADDPTNKLYNHIKSEYVSSVLEEYKKHRAATKVHHYYPGAMIEHVYEMMSFYHGLYKTGNLPPHNPLIVLLGIIFHDYGKIVCHPGTGGYTPLQSLFNHVYISTAQVQSWLEPFVEEDKSLLPDFLNLLHCILAHHKVLEHGSPVTPTTVEASLIISVDKLSADMNMIKNTVPGEYNKYLEANVYPNAGADFNLEII